MQPILIFRHIEHEGPGFFGNFLEQRQIPFEMVRIDAGDNVPDTVENASALVFMGGAMSVNDPLPWITDEIRLIKMAIEKEMPVLGHCLGGQLIAKTLGGQIRPNNVTEIGWHNTRKVDNDMSQDWLKDIDNEVELFHWHSETFSIPHGATPLLESEFCENQAFVYGKCLAMQCHIEMTEDLVMKWVNEDQGRSMTSASVQSANEMLENLPIRVSKLNNIASHIYTRWLKGL